MTIQTQIDKLKASIPPYTLGLEVSNKIKELESRLPKEPFKVKTPEEEIIGTIELCQQIHGSNFNIQKILNHFK